MREVVLSSHRHRAVLAVAIGFLAIVVVVAISSPGTNLFSLFWGGMAVALIYRLVAAPTRLWVDGQAIAIEAPWALRQPLRIDRQQVHSVYVFLVGPPTGWRSLGSRGREDHAAPGPTCWWAPDMGVGVDPPRLLIVLDPSLPMKEIVRLRTGPLLLFGLFDYRGPTRSTMARGLFFPVDDVGQAAEAFAAWPMPGPMGPALRTWVEGDFVRGRWGWKKAKTAR